MEAISTAAIDKILEIAPAKVINVGGFDYIDKNKTTTLAVPPALSPIKVHTLSGFVGLLENGFEQVDPQYTAVHVEAYDEVALISRSSDGWGRRLVYIQAEALAPERRFNFNTYYAQEEFNIALGSMFVQDENTAELLKLAGNLAATAEVRQEDDGFTQRVTAKAGVVRVAEITVKPRVTLKPFRTFLEVEQPAGEFIFRVKHDESRGNLCALFEADGGRWKLSAMDNVRTWLQNSLNGSSVVALNSLPVVA